MFRALREVNWVLWSMIMFIAVCILFGIFIGSVRPAQRWTEGMPGFVGSLFIVGVIAAALLKGVSDLSSMDAAPPLTEADKKFISQQVGSRIRDSRGLQDIPRGFLMDYSDAISGKKPED